MNFNNDDLDDEVNYHYAKLFTFNRARSGWQLPSPDVMFTSAKWEIAQMQSLKNELNSMKDKLNDFNLEEWHKHTRVTNPSSSLVWYVRKNINPELLTIAWCKMYQMLTNFPVIPDVAIENGFLNSLHLCEAPGAFITALNHYLKLNHPQLKWDWISNSMNPHYEENALSTMVDDDRFMIMTLDKWKFGADNTGNIKAVENFKALVAECIKLGPIFLITADGSVDCQNDPGNQEEIVASLHYCEVVCALHILSAGGTLIVKMFTMYEHSSICLLYLLNCCFETVHVHKPICSKEGNSENYVICINYDGTDERKPWLRVLRDRYSEDYQNTAIFPLLKIPEDFIEKLLQCAEFFTAYQTEVLERNIRLYLIEQPTMMKRIKRLQRRVNEVFIEQCKLQPLPFSDLEIVGKEKLEKVLQSNVSPRLQDTTFNERRQREELPPLEKLQLLKMDVSKININWTWGELRVIEFPRRSIRFKTTEGRPVSVVRSSKFCLGHLLNMRSQCAAIVQEIGLGMSYRWIGINNEIPEKMSKILQNVCPEILLEEHRVINFNDQLWSSLDCGRNEEFERKAFLAIFDEVDNLWRDVNLIILGYPMLTQLTAGIVYMLGHLFEEVGFLRPQGAQSVLIFRAYRSRDPAMASLMNQLVTEAEALLCRGRDRALLSLISISDLMENTKFYETVFATNMLTIQSHLVHLIETILEK